MPLPVHWIQQQQEEREESFGRVWLPRIAQPLVHTLAQRQDVAAGCVPDFPARDPISFLRLALPALYKGVCVARFDLRDIARLTSAIPRRLARRVARSRIEADAGIFGLGVIQSQPEAVGHPWCIEVLPQRVALGKLEVLGLHHVDDIAALDHALLFATQCLHLPLNLGLPRLGVSGFVVFAQRAEPLQVVLQVGHARCRSRRLARCALLPARFQDADAYGQRRPHLRATRQLQAAVLP